MFQGGEKERNETQEWVEFRILVLQNFWQKKNILMLGGSFLKIPNEWKIFEPNFWAQKSSETNSLYLIKTSPEVLLETQ